MENRFTLVIHGSAQFAPIHTGLCDKKYTPRSEIVWDREMYLDPQRQDIKFMLDKQKTEILRRALGIPNLIYGYVTACTAKTNTDWIELLKAYGKHPNFRFRGFMVSKRLHPNTQDFVSEILH